MALVLNLLIPILIMVLIFPVNIIQTTLYIIMAIGYFPSIPKAKEFTKSNLMLSLMVICLILINIFMH